MWTCGRRYDNLSVSLQGIHFGNFIIQYSKKTNYTLLIRHNIKQVVSNMKVSSNFLERMSTPVSVNDLTLFKQH